MNQLSGQRFSAYWTTALGQSTHFQTSLLVRGLKTSAMRPKGSTPTPNTDLQHSTMTVYRLDLRAYSNTH